MLVASEELDYVEYSIINEIFSNCAVLMNSEIVQQLLSNFKFKDIRLYHMKIDKHGNKIKVKSTEKRYLMNSIPYFIEIGEEWSPLIDQNCTEAKILYYGEQVEISRVEINSNDANSDSSEFITNRMNELESYEQSFEFSQDIQSELYQIAQTTNMLYFDSIREFCDNLEDDQDQFEDLYKDPFFCYDPSWSSMFMDYSSTSFLFGNN